MLSYVSRTGIRISVVVADMMAAAMVAAEVNPMRSRMLVVDALGSIS